jgi:hypothetical protein
MYVYGLSLIKITCVGAHASLVQHTDTSLALCATATRRARGGCGGAGALSSLLPLPPEAVTRHLVPCGVCVGRGECSA